MRPTEIVDNRDHSSSFVPWVPPPSQPPTLSFTVHPTTKRFPMRGPTAFFLSSVWTLFFAAFRFHHVAATTASPSFFPQVRTVLPIVSRRASFNLTHFRHSCLTGIPRGQHFPYPSPVRTVDFSCGGLPVCSLDVQSNVKLCTLHGSVGPRA